MVVVALSKGLSGITKSRTVNLSPLKEAYSFLQSRIPQRQYSLQASDFCYQVSKAPALSTDSPRNARAYSI